MMVDVPTGESVPDNLQVLKVLLNRLCDILGGADPSHLSEQLSRTLKKYGSCVEAAKSDDSVSSEYYSWL